MITAEWGETRSYVNRWGLNTNQVFLGGFAGDDHFADADRMVYL